MAGWVFKGQREEFFFLISENQRQHRRQQLETGLKWISGDASCGELSSSESEIRQKKGPFYTRQKTFNFAADSSPLTYLDRRA